MNLLHTLEIMVKSFDLLISFDVESLIMKSYLFPSAVAFGVLLL